jgi:hypothetical protein
MADFFKGLAGGMQTGLQFGEAIRKRRMEDELAQAYAKPETSQGYTAETGQQLEELAKTGAYDIVPQYAPAAEGQTQGVFTGYQAVPKAGLDLQGDVPAAPMAFNPQQVQDYGGRRVAGQFDPTQLRGLQMQEAARVLGSYGDVRGAAALETQADELRRGLARDKREEAAEADRVARRPLEIKQLENALVSQGLTIAEAQRVAAEQVSISSAREKLQTLRKDGPLTAAIISNVAGEFKLDPTKFLQAEDAVNTLEIKDLKRDLSKAAMGGDTTFNNFLAAKFDPDKTDNITPKVTKAKDGSFVVMYGDRVLPEYGTHKNMMSLVGGVINMIDQNPFATLTTLSTLDKNAAAIEESKAGTKLKNAQAGAVGLEKLSPLEKNLNTLKRLNIPVTDAQIKTLVLGAQKDPALEAELAAITKIAGSDTANPKVLEALPGQIQAALARSKGRETAAAVVSGLVQAQEAGKGAEAIADLRRRQMPEPAIQAAAAQAGVPYIAPPAAATQPQAQPPRGLTSGAQPAPYVPPAGSRAAIAQEARAQATATQAESARLAAQAQSRLAADYAADARTLSPVELVRKYDRVRGQLPREQALELQTIQRNIR